jgi:hypothetical protein
MPNFLQPAQVTGIAIGRQTIRGEWGKFVGEMIMRFVEMREMSIEQENLRATKSKAAHLRQLSALGICAHPGGEGGFIESARCEAQDGMCRGFLGRGEIVAVHFQEQGADEEAGALIAVEKRMIANNASRVRSSQADDVGVTAIGMDLPRAGKGGLE